MKKAYLLYLSVVILFFSYFTYVAIEKNEWRKAASSIAEKVAPKDLEKFFKIHEVAQEIAGQYGRKNKWYIKEKSEKSITIYLGMRKGGGKTITLLFPDKDFNRYSDDYVDLQRGKDVVFLYNPDNAFYPVNNPAELLQPILMD